MAKVFSIRNDKEHANDLIYQNMQDQKFEFNPKVFSRLTDKGFNSGLNASLNQADQS